MYVPEFTPKSQYVYTVHIVNCCTFTVLSVQIHDVVLSFAPFSIVNAKTKVFYLFSRETFVRHACTSEE